MVIKKRTASWIVALSIIASSIQAAPPDLTRGGKTESVELKVQVLANEDGLIRGLAASIYPMLSAEDVKAFLPEILAATRKNAPRGEMFRMGIRWTGLELLARFRIREGMGLCVDMMNEFE